ncbi:putative quinol monooxygenase [Seleniivibrio woodruffii]|uniref:putative quinol monooxygenase n=1 Tax=Seleniivibrio woodruffii TaxID=1078050 RepID=UPI0039E4B50F
MFIIHVKATLKEGYAEKFLNGLLNVRPDVLKEDGCGEYTITILGDQVFCFEIWESDAHLDAHMKQPYMVEFFEKSKDWHAKDIEIKKYEVAQ